MPRKEPFRRQRLIVVTGRVEHHFDDALNISINCFQAAYVHSQSASNRRANLFGIEFFPFDLAALDDIGGKRPQQGFLAELKPEALHAAQQTTLFVANPRQRLRDGLAVPVKFRPIRECVDIPNY